MNLAEATIVDRLTPEDQRLWIELAGDVRRAAPMLRPTAGGLAMSVRITNAGSLGWVADSRGYHYTPTHPVTGKPWPPIPHDWILRASKVAGEHPWDCAHLVWYGPGASLGWHRDKTEARRFPIYTASLGDEAIWKVRADELIHAARLVSGSEVVLGGETRDALHTIERIEPAGMFAPSPLAKPGRLAISLRVAG